MAWQQLHLQCQKPHALGAEALLFEAGAVSVLLEDAGDEPLFEPLPGESPLWQEIVVTAIFDTNSDESSTLINLDFESLANHIASQVNASRFWLSLLDDKDWTREWMSYYHPIQCSDNLWVIPQWITPPDKHATNVILDPGLAFGTGYHATTRLCLEWLSHQNLQGKTVIDYGCGSGVLGIAALLLGAKQVFAVDIDPQAILATQQNAKHNGIIDNIQAMLPNEFLAYWQDTKLQADIITANILAKPLIELTPFFAKIIKPHGSIVLAGLIESQISDVTHAYNPYFKMSPSYHFDNNEDRHWHRLSGIRTTD